MLNCEKCRYFVQGGQEWKDGSDVGYCYLNPPVLDAQENENGEMLSAWVRPMVRKGQFCQWCSIPRIEE